MSCRELAAVGLEDHILRPPHPAIFSGHYCGMCCAHRLLAALLPFSAETNQRSVNQIWRPLVLMTITMKATTGRRGGALML